MSDLLADWWVHPIVIKRTTGSGSRVVSYAAPETVIGFVSDGTKLVAGPNGKQISSSAQVALPIGTAYVPVDSLVTLPAQFGGRTCTVVVSMVGDGGGQPTPDHVQLALL